MEEKKSSFCFQQLYLDSVSQVSRICHVLHQVPAEMLKTHYYDHKHACSTFESIMKQYCQYIGEINLFTFKIAGNQNSATNQDILNFFKYRYALTRFYHPEPPMRCIYCNKLSVLIKRLLSQNYHI